MAGTTSERIAYSSLCVCPVQSVNDVRIGSGRLPGPVTGQLTDAYCRLVDVNFVAQDLERLG